MGALVVAAIGAVVAWRWSLRSGSPGPAAQPSLVGAQSAPEAPAELALPSAVAPSEPAATLRATAPEPAAAPESAPAAPPKIELRAACRAAKERFDLCQEKLLEDPAVAALSVVSLSILAQLELEGRFEPLPDKFAAQLGDPEDGVYRIPVGDRLYSFESAEFPEYAALTKLIEARAEVRASVVAELQPGQAPPLPSYEPLPAELLTAVEKHAARATQ